MNENDVRDSIVALGRSLYTIAVLPMAAPETSV